MYDELSKANNILPPPPVSLEKSSHSSNFGSRGDYFCNSGSNFMI